MTKRVIVASTNPVKTEAARDAFVKLFPHDEIIVEGISVPSGVNDQPMTNEETLQGALNRVEAAAQAMPAADYWVGIEGGIQIIDNEMGAFAWAVVKDRHQVGKGRTGEFFLPNKIKELVEAGKSLGEADDIVFGRAGSGKQNGSVGLLTNDLITRKQFHEDAVILALAPFAHEDLYATP